MSIQDRLARLHRLQARTPPQAALPLSAELQQTAVKCQAHFARCHEKLDALISLGRESFGEDPLEGVRASIIEQERIVGLLEDSHRTMLALLSSQEEALTRKEQEIKAVRAALDAMGRQKPGLLSDPCAHRLNERSQGFSSLISQWGTKK